MVGRILVAGAVVLLFGCSGDESAATVEPDALPPDAAPPRIDRRPTPENVVAASGEAVGAVELHAPTTTVALAPWAHVLAPPASTVGGRDLTAPEEGHEGVLTYDIDGDGEPQTVHSFVPDRAEYAFLGWENSGFCHLTWERFDVTRYVFSACNAVAGEPTHVCAQPKSAARTCQRCVGEACEPCDAHIEDGAVVCTPFDDGIPDAVDAGPPAADAAGPSVPDAGAVEPDLGPPPPALHGRYLLTFYPSQNNEDRRVDAEFESVPEERTLTATFRSFGFLNDGSLEVWDTQTTMDRAFGADLRFTLNFVGFSLWETPEDELELKGEFRADGTVCGTYSGRGGLVEGDPITATGVFSGRLSEDPVNPAETDPAPCE